MSEIRVKQAEIESEAKSSNSKFNLELEISEALTCPDIVEEITSSIKEKDQSAAADRMVEAANILVTAADAKMDGEITLGEIEVQNSLLSILNFLQGRLEVSIRG